MRALVLLTAALGLGSGCTTMAVIHTVPPGARVYLRGQYVGQSPVEVELKDGLGEGTYYRVRVEKEGHEPQETKLDQHWSVGGIILDALLVLPTFGGSIYLGYFNAKRHCDEYVLRLPPSRAPPPVPTGPVEIQ